VRPTFTGRIRGGSLPWREVYVAIIQPMASAIPRNQRADIGPVDGERQPQLRCETG